MNLSNEIKGYFLGEKYFNLTLNNYGCYVGGVKKIISFSNESILLLVEKSNLNIKGERLTLTKICDGDVCIKGSIFGLEVKKI